MATTRETANLALCLETAEAAGCEAKLIGLEAYRAQANRYEIARFGHTILLSAPMSRRNSSFNRALAFSSLDRTHLADILQWLRERDAYWFDVAPVLVDGPLLQALVNDGLHLATLTQVLCMHPTELENRPEQGVDVQEIEFQHPDQLHDFGVVVHHGLKFPQSLVEAMYRVERAKYSEPAWHTYLATVDGVPAARAALHIADGIATLDEVDAIPRYRGLGCRTALLQRCIADAGRAGCELIAGQTQPNSDSDRLMIRAGFQIVYTKRLYSRETRGHYDQ